MSQIGFVNINLTKSSDRPWSAASRRSSRLRTPARPRDRASRSPAHPHG
jgi:hypothetical protein